jgi:hypothetical protein
MEQYPLGLRRSGVVAAPEIQSRLLNGTGERKAHGPRQSGFEPGVHGIQAGRGQFAGLTA